MTPLEKFCARRGLLDEHVSIAERFVADRDLEQFCSPPDNLLALSSEDIALHNFHLIKPIAIKFCQTNPDLRAIWSELIEAGFGRLILAANRINDSIEHPVGYLRSAIRYAMIDTIKDYQGRSTGVDFNLIEETQNREGRTDRDNKLDQLFIAPKCGDLLKAHDKLFWCCDDTIDRDILYQSWRKDPTAILMPKHPDKVAKELGLETNEVVERLEGMRQRFEHFENLIRAKQHKRKFDSRPWAFATAS